MFRIEGHSVRELPSLGTTYEPPEVTPERKSLGGAQK